MSQAPADDDRSTSTSYDPEGEQALSEAVIDAIEAHKDIDATREQLALYE